MALVTRRIALAIATVAGLLAVVATPATPAAAADIRAPQLLSPANDGTVHLSDIVLKWGAVAGASEYQVQVSPNHEWTNNKVGLLNNGDVIDPLLELPVYIPNATYYWHVRAKVGGVWGPYSSNSQFVKDWDAPITVLKQPTSADPTLTWAPVKDASLYLVRYLPVGTPFFSTPGLAGEVDCWTAETSVTPYASDITPNPEPVAGPGAQLPSVECGDPDKGSFTLVNDTVYEWELIAFDDSSVAEIGADTDINGQIDCESSDEPLCDSDVVKNPNGFLYEAPEAGSPSKLGTVTGLKTTWHTSTLPGNTCDATNSCPMTPTFSWDPVPGANFYQVNLFRDPDMTNLYRSVSTSWPELTLSSTLFDAQAGQPYYWTVSAGTCSISSTDPTCAPSGATGDTCTAGKGTSKPTLGTDPADIKASPPGPLGDQSMLGGTTATITVEGSGLQGPACIVPSAGTVDESTVSVGFGGLVTFTYFSTVATSNQQVTFKVVNNDGAESNASAPLTVIAGSKVILYQTSKPATFAKRSGPISLVAPANHAVITGTSPTFKWLDFMNTGGDESYDARNYDLQISTDHSFDSIVLDQSDIDLTQYTNPTALLANGSYYWRVAAIDSSAPDPVGGEVLTWSPARQLTVNAAAPTISFLSANGADVGQPLLIQLTTPLRDLNGQTLKVVPAGAPVANAVHGRLVEGSSPLIYSFFPHVPLATGATYGLRLTQTVLDDTGNDAVVGGDPIRTSLTALDTSPGWQYSTGWTRHAASGALSGSYAQAKAGHIATLEVAGSEIVLYGCKAPNMGHITVNVAGQTYTLSENQSFTTCGIPLWHGAIPSGIRVLTVRVANGNGNFDAVVVDGGASSGTGTGTTGTGTTGTGTTTTTTTPTTPAKS